MVSFDDLPEDCVSNILRRTSPQDACNASAVSRGFKSAIDSDTVWEQFLPSDHTEILSRVVSDLPAVLYTKKDLYRRLAKSHVLLDGGKMSFSLEKLSGKKCYMLAANQLVISLGDNPQYWKWKSLSDSRFSEAGQVAELLSNARSIQVQGRFQTKLLSPKTMYEAYLVVKLPKGNSCEAAHSSVMYAKDRDKMVNVSISTRIRLCGSGYQRLLRLNKRRRSDGWMEVRMGQFYNDTGDDGEVDARFNGMDFQTSGLVIEGMEFRPKNND